MPIYNNHQQELAQSISATPTCRSQWKDWKWQMENAIQGLDSFEKLLSVNSCIESVHVIASEAKQSPFDRGGDRFVFASR